MLQKTLKYQFSINECVLLTFGQKHTVRSKSATPSQAENGSTCSQVFVTFLMSDFSPWWPVGNSTEYFFSIYLFFLWLSAYNRFEKSNFQNFYECNARPENEVEWWKMRCFLTFWGEKNAQNALKFCENSEIGMINLKM